MERSHLLRPQPQELSTMPVQNKPKSGCELPGRTRLVAYLTILCAISAHWPRLWPRAHITRVLARERACLRMHARARATPTAINDKT